MKIRLDALPLNSELALFASKLGENDSMIAD